MKNLLQPSLLGLLGLWMGCNQVVGIREGKPYPDACVTVDDCDKGDPGCRVATCEDERCVYVDEPEGTPLPAPSQTIGDCQEVQCNGQGRVRVVEVELDVPDDSEPCTQDICVGSVPTHLNLDQTPCYTGPSGTELLGNCRRGIQRCEMGKPVGACLGERVPTAETCTTIFDDDCDGNVNEEGLGCVCVPGALGTCYPGTQETLGYGACAAGAQVCNALGTAYEACTGFVGPSAETCDMAQSDEDCDGKRNEEGADCVCGDGFVSGSEACDDGNVVDGDACSSQCRIPGCGNQQVEMGEECDDGNTENGDACTSQCKNAVCGDGFVQLGVEQCDDGNTNNDDACTTSCKPPPCGDGIIQTSETCDDGGRMLFGDGCATSCNIVPGYTCAGLPSACVAYAKASNTSAADHFGHAIAISADGNTVAIGAPLEGSNATGINGDQTNMSTMPFGAVYVFVRSATGTWEQQAYVKASNTGPDEFGHAVALSADGNTLVVGARDEDGSAPGINGNQMLEGSIDSGAVYVFTRNGSAWSQEAYIKASTVSDYAQFGYEVALAGDGNTLAVSSIGERGCATGVNGNEMNLGCMNAGAVYVFVRNAGMWSQQAYVKASNAAADDYFGVGMALSASGDTLAVGATGEDSSATGINGDQMNDSIPLSGAAYVFVRNGSTWSQQAYVKASNAGASDLFGSSVAVSADGNTLAIAAQQEYSAASGANANQLDNNGANSGATYVFTRNGSTWTQEVYIKASNNNGPDYFGYSVALASDGNTLAVGAFIEDSNATGINGDQMNETATNSGAVYVFTRSGGIWVQHAYVKASNTGANDEFGSAVALSGNGGTLVVGALKEDSNAKGIHGDQADNTAGDAGAVYIY